MPHGENRDIAVAAASSTVILSVRLAIFVLALSVVATQHTSAAITTTGNVTPDPTTSTGFLYIGRTDDGELTIDDGSDVVSSRGHLGFESGVTGTVTVDGIGSTWTGGSHIYVGREGHGILTVTGGGTVTSSAWGIMGDVAGSTGVVTVDGTDSAWINSGSFVVGSRGHGTLTVTSGGMVSSNRGYIGSGFTTTGTVTIDGVDSTWINSDSLDVGPLGQGTLNITGGGLVDVSSEVWVNRRSETGSTIQFNNGTLNAKSVFTAQDDLQGVGTINTEGWLFDQDLALDALGSLPTQITLNNEPGQSIVVNLNWTGQGTFGADHGTLTLNNGAMVTSSSGYIGYGPGSTGGNVTVEGVGSTWTNSDWLSVGGHGQGALDITGGGAVTSSTGHVGESAGSNGTASVDGVGSTWTTSGRLYVGNAGQGMLSIVNSGAVSSLSGTIGNSSGSVGSVTVDGPDSNWAVDGSLDVGFSGQGMLNITGGGTVFSSSGYLARRASQSTGSVTVDGVGSAWTTAGSLSVGSSGQGTLNITRGGAITVDGTLFFYDRSALAFTLAGVSDPLLDVTGNATLDGSLTIDLDPTLTLQPNDTFTLIDIGSTQSGTFANLAEGDLAASDGVFDLWLTYAGGDGNDVEVFTLPTVLGDMNADGLFDSDDAGPFVQALTNQAAYESLYPTINIDLRGDFNGDGFLTLADVGPFKALLAQNGLSFGSQQVPEPGAIILALLALAGLACHRPA